MFKQSKAVAVTSMAFPLGDVNNFVVGSEDGSVYTACRHGRWDFRRLLCSFAAASGLFFTKTQVFSEPREFLVVPGSQQEPLLLVCGSARSGSSSMNREPSVVSLLQQGRHH